MRPAADTVELRPAEQARTAVLDRLGIASGAELRFVFGSPRCEGSTLALPYAIPGVASFTETFELPGVDLAAAEARPEVAGAIRLLHLVAGVSYFKALLPPVIETAGPVEPALADLLDAVYSHGLGEFAYRNGIDLAGLVTFPRDGETPPPPATALDRGPLVPVGGGKDSVVTLEAVRRHLDDVTLFAVNPRPPIERTIAVSELPSRTVRRRLDPALFDLNDAGALNGHVPITAIVSAVAVLVAAIHRHRAVVLSNERSADTGNVAHGGVQVNHQWSKSAAFERPFAAVVRRLVHADLTYLSLLRPVSELAVARVFAGLERYHGAFNSCNRAFSLRGETTEWCGDCPKCRFVFLALAPFLGRAALVAVFGRDLLDDPAQRPGFEELIGARGIKPWECVGEIEESRAAMDCLAEREGWHGSRLVGELGRPDAGGCAAVAALARLDGPVDLPEPYAGIVRATF